ncbi:putative porin [Shewanella woodyi]|uniref:putative porin n=1 Tax=Shewanella woodyi TaxID=60961 RepID=UPI0007F8EFBE|nr:putative porin [Shewanella woodyi]
MKNSTMSLAILLGLTSMSAAAAQDNAFQHQASLDYQTNSEEVSDGFWKANYRYYIAPVDQSNSPYALNGFLAQTTNLGASYSKLDVANFDSDSYGVDGTYVFASKWFVSASYQQIEAFNTDVNFYSAEVGYYFNDSSAVSAFYADGDNNTVEAYGLNLRSFVALESTAGVDLTANWAHTDFDDAFNLGADWYVNNSWSVGAGYHNNDANDDFSLRTAYWLRISDNFSANFNLSKLLDSDVDGVGMSVGVVGRF